MERGGTRRQRRKRAQRFLFAALVVLLVGFSVWSIWLLLRAQRLRAELDSDFAWIDEVRAVQAELRLLAGFGRGAAGSSKPAARERIESFASGSGERPPRPEDPELEIAVRGLRGALDALPSGAAPADADAADALWSATVAALAAATDLEARIRGHVTALHQRLGAHWRSLWLLVSGILVLAALDLALLVVNHRRRRELEAAHAEALSSARHDPLTGLWNRNGILRLLGRELDRAARSQTPLGAILADIVGFQRVNDLLGHDQGDYLLAQVGQRLQALVRPYDTVGRSGGDSFLVVLPACDATATEHVARRLREAIEEHDVKHGFGRVRLRLELARLTVAETEETDVDTVLRQLQEKIEAGKAAAAS